MYQSGYLESEMWEEGFTDPHAWYVDVQPPDLTAGVYNAGALTITATGTWFFAYQGSGDLYYRKDGGSWIPMPLYLSWSSMEIVGKLTAILAYGDYDLRIVRSDTAEDILIGAFSVLPSEPSTYWVNYAGGAGSGTELSPWSLTQLKAYFNNDVGYFPTDGDLIYVKGDIVATASDAYIFLVNVGDSKTITIKAWDKETNGMHTISPTKSGIDVFSIESGSSDVHLVIHDCAILPTDTAGPTSALPVLVRSKDDSSGDNSIALKGCMIITRQNFKMVAPQSHENTDVAIYGSTIVVAGGAMFRIIEHADNALIYDTAVNLEEGSWIHYVSGNLIWDHCEFNCNSPYIPGTKTDCNFNNESLELLPKIVSYSTFLENDFNYYIYNIQNAGRGASIWIANDYAYDIKGYTRLGIGAFRFERNDYYVSGSSQDSGDGSASSPFTLNQLRNYFNSSLGESCGVSPTGYDSFLLKGIFAPVDDFFLNIDEEIGGYITIKCDEIVTNKAWFIETKDIS